MQKLFVCGFEAVAHFYKPDPQRREERIPVFNKQGIITLILLSPDTLITLVSNWKNMQHTQAAESPFKLISVFCLVLQHMSISSFSVSARLTCVNNKECTV